MRWYIKLLIAFNALASLMGVLAIYIFLTSPLAISFPLRAGVIFVNAVVVLLSGLVAYALWDSEQMRMQRKQNEDQR